MITKHTDYVLSAIILLITLFSVLIAVYVFYGFSNLVFNGFPKILDHVVAALPINNIAYPTLLQGLLIVASMIFGFYGILLFYSAKELNDVIDKHKIDSFIPKLVLFIIMLFPLFFLISSIFYSLNGLAYYGITTTFATEQINTGHIPISISNLSMENSTYFNSIKNYSNATVGDAALGYYNKLLANTQNSINWLFLSGELVTLILIAYLIVVFGGSEYLYKKYTSSHRNAYTIDAVIIISLLILFIYFKLYALAIELAIFIIIVAIIVIILIGKSKKKNKGEESKSNNFIPPLPPSSPV